MVDGDEMSPRTRPDPTLCYLCGEPIGRVTASMDHVPPARFFSTALRPTLRRPLLTLRTHPACHSGWDREEEYFYNSLLPSVLDAPLGPSLAADFRASQRHPENRRLAETVRRQFERNPGGLHLPPGLLVQRFDGARLTAVAWKIVRGLFAGGTCVAALAKRVGLPGARISHHLAILRAAGIVEGERDGQRVIYRLSREFHGSPKSHALDFGCCVVRFLALEGETCESKG